MRKISEVLRLHYDLKCSYREIARGQNVSTSTVHEYLARAKAAKIDMILILMQIISILESIMDLQLSLPAS